MVWCEMRPMRERAGAPPGREIPEIRALPAEGLSRPARTRSRVVLPAPLGPKSARHSPALSENETLATAFLAPNDRPSPATSSRGAAARVAAVMCLELATLARGAQNAVSFRARPSADANDRTNERHRRSSPGKQEIQAGSEIGRAHG